MAESTRDTITLKDGQELTIPAACKATVRRVGDRWKIVFEFPKLAVRVVKTPDERHNT